MDIADMGGKQMSDLISRRKAIKAIEDMQDCYNGFSDTYDKACIIGVLEELPSAEPEQKTGKWIFKNDLKQFFCSECGFPSLTYDDIYIYGMDLPNYCEDCGVKMEGEEDDME